MCALPRRKLRECCAGERCTKVLPNFCCAPELSGATSVLPIMRQTLSLFAFAVLGCGTQPAQSAANAAELVAPSLTVASAAAQTSATPTVNPVPQTAPSAAPALNAKCTFLGPPCAAGLQCNTAPSHERNAPGICSPKGSWTGAAEGGQCGTIAGLRCNPGLVCLTQAIDMDDASGICSK
jgi:hypothetical protein